MGSADKRRQKSRSVKKNQHKPRQSQGGRAAQEKKTGRRQPRFAEELKRNRLENEQAIAEFKQESPLCARCGKPITDMAAALSEKGGEAPLHFDCVLEFLKENESLAEGESIAYIGQGRFAVVSGGGEDGKGFTIQRIIEWEGRENKNEWRSRIASLYSRIY